MSRTKKSNVWPITALMLSCLAGSVIAPQVWREESTEVARNRSYSREARPLPPLPEPLRPQEVTALRSESSAVVEASPQDVPQPQTPLRSYEIENAMLVPVVEPRTVIVPPPEIQPEPTSTIELAQPTITKPEISPAIVASEAKPPRQPIDPKLYEVPSPSTTIDVPPTASSELPRSLFAMETGPQRPTVYPSVASHFNPRVVEHQSAASLDAPITSGSPTATQLPRRQTDETSLEELDRVLLASNIRLARRAALIVPQVESCWPLPTELTERLDPMLENPVAAAWASEVMQTLKALNSVTQVDDPSTPVLFARLKKLLDEAPQVSARLGICHMSSELLRTGYAIHRRLSVWKHVQLTGTQTHPVSISATDDRLKNVDRYAMILDAHLDDQQGGQAWRDYLLLDHVHRYADPNSGVLAEWRRKLAREVLYRVDSPFLTVQQRQLFAKEPFAGFCEALESWATAPVDYMRLVDDIERFESYGRPSDSRELAEVYQRLRWSGSDAAQKLGDQINNNYRNANIRVAMSAQLMSQMLPKPKSVRRGVNDTVLGARVFGQTQTTAQLGLRMVPSKNRLQMVLSASGRVQSNTRSSSGPASFQNRGFADYTAQKLVTITHQGMHVSRAEAQAEGRTNLVGMQTNYDDIPLIGQYARSVAEKEYNQKSYQANEIMERRIESQVRAELDREVTAELAKAKASFNEKILVPLQKRQLNPIALGLETTDKRAIIRYRIAAHDQLAAFTPRPQAPSDSLLSVQIHQSAINNTLSELGLAGNEFTLHQLVAHLASTFDWAKFEVPEDMPEGVTIRFTKRDPVRVLLKNGEVRVALKISKIESPGGHRWQNFYVITTYKPETTRKTAKLKREDLISIAGPRIGFGERVALQAIFNKVFSQHKPIEVISRKFIENPKFNDVQLNQFVISDGWLGVAVGPSRKYITHAYPESGVRR